MPRRTIVQLLPALHSGGVERSTLEIAAALVAAGHRSIVISAGGRLVPLLEREGSEHIALPVGVKSLRIVATASRLRRTLAELKPDLVHVRSRLPAWCLRLALRGLESPPPVVSTVHGLNSPGRYSGIMTRAERIICVSQTVRAHVLRHWPATDPDRLRVIERGIDPSQFPRGHQASEAWLRRLHGEHPELRGGRLLLLPGRGTRLKGHADAVRLLAALRAAGEDARLWLLGADEPGRRPYLAEIERLAWQLGVRSALAISAPRDDVREAYAAADLVLQLSGKPEAFGRTVLEALSVGRPVLGWDHGGVGELLQALYPAGAVPLHDMDGLTAAARRLLAAPAPMPVTIPQTLAAMQAATLRVHDELLAD
ncbi:glycosyltransferase [Arenimonas fontis]|uniref:Glycosyltransferase family 4 protein n=1 Tax=Arenimonas fontis TaxID=2608255 RepID=A0A5B2ZB52_9GAMM|nr:glycosyltransferase [Arenimonas fontis]KAA2284362.1 glycosyltransferase family 4 protein [Arenimonas fontis]